MSLGYDTEAKINKAVCKNQKHITVTFPALFCADALTISEKLVRGFSGEFKKVHESEKEARNIQCKILIKGFSIGEDMGGKTSAKLVEIRKQVEKKTGLHLSGFDAMYQQVDKENNELPNWSFHFSFYDVDPTDTFTGTSSWNFYRW